MAALAFAPSAQAASSYNVMLIDAPANVKSVSLWDNDTESDSAIGCFKVQPGRDTNTKYKISVKHFLAAYKYGTDNCSSNYKGKVKSPRVKSSLSTINFWFYLS